MFYINSKIPFFNSFDMRDLQYYFSNPSDIIHVNALVSIPIFTSIITTPPNLPSGPIQSPFADGNIRVYFIRKMLKVVSNSFDALALQLDDFWKVYHHPSTNCSTCSLSDVQHCYQYGVATVKNMRSGIPRFY